MVQWLKSVNIKNKLKKRAFWGKMLGIFFVVMLLCTFVSRAADSVIMPKAQLFKPAPGNLNYKMKGTGSVVASEGELVTVPDSLRVKEITKPGTNVEAGDVLAVTDTDELSRVIEEQNAKLAQLKLQLEGERVNATPDAVTPQTFSAGKSLALEQKHYNEAADKLAAAEAAEKNEAAERQRKAEEDKKAAYDIFLEQGGESNPEAKSIYDQTVSGIEQELERAAAEKKAQIDALEESRNAAADALEQAQTAYEVAAKEDENAKANRQKAQQGSDITQQGLEIDIQQQQKVVDRLNAIMDAGGIIKSPVKGTVTENSLTEGMVTSGQEYIRIGTGGYEFLASVDKENAQRLKVGDTMEVEFAGLREKKKLKIADIRAEMGKGGEGGTGDGTESSPGTSQNQGEVMYITAKLEGNEYTDGMTGDYAVNKDSDIRYDWILPIEAVREDQKGVFCLVARKKSTILGEEYVAERLNLTKKAKDVGQMAVEGAFTGETKIIKGSNKEINEGDRFRVEEED